jgi:hypothetical protein
MQEGKQVRCARENGQLQNEGQEHTLSYFHSTSFNLMSVYTLTSLSNFCPLLKLLLYFIRSLFHFVFLLYFLLLLYILFSPLFL